MKLIADEVELPKSDVHQIISEDLHMRKVYAKLIPKVLTEKQKNLRVTICDDLCDSVESKNDLMDFVITDDETGFSSTILRAREKALSGTRQSPLDRKRPE